MQTSKGWIIFVVVTAALCALIVGGIFYSRSAKQISDLKDELAVVSQKLRESAVQTNSQTKPATSTEEVTPEVPASTVSTTPASDTSASTTASQGNAVIKVEKDAQGVTYVSKDGGKFYELVSSPSEEFAEEVIKQTDNYLYIAGKQTGLGGYILIDSAYRSLKRIDMKTGDIKEIVTRGQLEVYDISADEKYVLLVDTANHKIMMRDMNTLTDKKFSVDEKYGQFGDAFFSPDGKKIVYAAALGKPDAEAGAIITIDIAAGKSVIYKQTTKADTYFTVTGWGGKGIQYTVKPSNL